MGMKSLGKLRELVIDREACCMAGYSPWGHKESDMTEQLNWTERKWKWSRSVMIDCDPMDCSLPGSSVHGIFKARVLEWVAISFSRGSSQPRDQTWVSQVVGRRFYCLSHQGTEWLIECFFFKWFLVICVCSLEKCLFKSFAYFWMGCLFLKYPLY